ncbi:membrane-associating domain-containing protein [Elsinoe australis]|uniref:Membrane-associating domain-containing protein n=1 Tax=Elsinoe australis TaxID=40998 RepID=A0A4U7AWB0_9PEZI|nr:membrane-associating domain-containing protein [Elsinoe australis]
MPANRLGVAIRALQLAVAILSLSLVLILIINNNKDGGVPILNFDVAVAVLTLLSFLYLIPATIKDLDRSTLVLLKIDAVVALLHFIAAISTTALLESGSCSDESYTSNNTVINGYPFLEYRCKVARAATGSLFFNAVLISIAATRTWIEHKKNKSVVSKDEFDGFENIDGPAMIRVLPDSGNNFS